MSDLESIIKNKKFDTPYNLTIEFLNDNYANLPEIIPYDLVEYMQNYLNIHVGSSEKVEKDFKQELKSKLNIQ